MFERLKGTAAILAYIFMVFKTPASFLVIISASVAVVNNAKPYGVNTATGINPLNVPNANVV